MPKISECSLEVAIESALLQNGPGHIMKDRPPRKCARFGQLVAHCSLRDPGAREALPTLRFGRQIGGTSDRRSVRFPVPDSSAL